MVIQEILSTYNFDGRLKKYCDDFGIETIVCEIATIDDYCHDEKLFWEVMVIARDLELCSDLSDVQLQEFTNLLHEHSFFERLELCLYNPKLSIKSTAVFTFGKFSRPEYAPLLEKAFRSEYYLNNPILAAKCLGEIRWLQSSISETLRQIAIAHKDLINLMTIGIDLATISGRKQDLVDLLHMYREDISNVSELVESGDISGFFWTYELFVTNIHHANGLKDWNREEYISSISYYCKNRKRLFPGDGKRPDYKSIYQEMFQSEKSS